MPKINLRLLSQKNLVQKFTRCYSGCATYPTKLIKIKFEFELSSGWATMTRPITSDAGRDSSNPNYGGHCSTCSFRLHTMLWSKPLGKLESEHTHCAKNGIKCTNSAHPKLNLVNVLAGPILSPKSSLLTKSSLYLE